MPILNAAPITLVKVNAAGDTAVPVSNPHLDVVELPAIRSAVLKNPDGSYVAQNYMLIVDSDDSAILVKIYDDSGVLQTSKLAIGNLDTSVNQPSNIIEEILNSGELPVNHSYAETQILTAKATKALIDSLISADDTEDEAFATAAASAVQTAFEAADVVLRTDLTAEVTRAQAAEATNATAISNEVTRAQAAEATNATAIATEKSRAETAEAGLQADIDGIDISGIATNATAIATEKSRAETAEAGLQTAIDGIDISGIATNATAIATEKSRAETAEATLQTAIAAETTARQAALNNINLPGIATNATDIATNATAIATEKSRAETAEAGLQADIDGIDISGIATNATAIATEKSRAETVEANLQTSIDGIPDQITAAIAANDIIDDAARLAVTTAFQNADVALNTSLTNEINRAEAAEAGLQSDIDAIDLSGIATNATAIATEKSRAETAEANLQTAISSEATARQNALNGIDLSGIATNSTDIADEITRATAAEATLQAGITNNATSINALSGGADFAQIATNKTNIETNVAGITTNATAAATNAAGITTNATALATNAAGITTNATALATNAAAIATNSAGITTNATAITSEISAREASDLLLQADILTVDDKYDTLISSSIPASYLLKIDGNDVVISTDGVNVGNNDPAPNNLTAIQELYAQINNLITQALPASSMFKPIGNDFVVSGFLSGHAGGSLIEFSTGDIILPTEPTGFPESSFTLSEDFSEIIFGD